MAVCARSTVQRTKDRHVSRSVGRGVSGRWSGPIFAFSAGFRLLSHSAGFSSVLLTVYAFRM